MNGLDETGLGPGVHETGDEFNRARSLSVIYLFIIDVTATGLMKIQLRRSKSSSPHGPS